MKLQAFLKIKGIAETGGQAKIMIQDGLVKINGVVCTQRGKQLQINDEIEVSGEIYVYQSDNIWKF